MCILTSLVQFVWKDSLPSYVVHVLVDFAVLTYPCGIRHHWHTMLDPVESASKILSHNLL